MESDERGGDAMAGAASPRGEGHAHGERRETLAYWTWDQMSAFAREGLADGETRRPPEGDAIRLVIECESILALGLIPCVELPEGGPARVGGIDARRVSEARWERVGAVADSRATNLPAVVAVGASRPAMQEEALVVPHEGRRQASNAGPLRDQVGDGSPDRSESRASRADAPEPPMRSQRVGRLLH